MHIFAKMIKFVETMAKKKIENSNSRRTYLKNKKREAFLGSGNNGVFILPLKRERLYFGTTVTAGKVQYHERTNLWKEQY